MIDIIISIFLIISLILIIIFLSMSSDHKTELEDMMKKVDELLKEAENKINMKNNKND